jgi:succinate dehydrogenase/fumarate reductase flavoprotein subunit
VTAAEERDVIVLGGGAAGMTAAALAAAGGLDVLLIEKAAQVGGTTAISGGMVWVPGNTKTAAAGRPDSLDAARRYLVQTVPGDHNLAVREAFLANAPRMVDALEARTSVRLQPVMTYPDYFPDLPGATTGGRVLEPVPFDARRLGRHLSLLRRPLPEFTVLGGMMVPRADLIHFRNLGRSWRATARVARLVAAYGWQRLSYDRGTSLVLGNALAARLLDSLLRRNVGLALGTTVSALMTEGRRICGVVAAGRDIRARRGVVLATGGFSHDPALRAALLPEVAGPLSAANPANTGDGLRLALAVGGAIEQRGEGAAFWTPVSRFVRKDGSVAVFPHTVTDRGKPGVIAVDATGCRFVNEALSYHAFVSAMLRRCRVDASGTATAFLICDRPVLRRYGFGAVPPFTPSLRRWMESGYLIEAPTIPALAQALGLDPARLEQTVARYNDGARRGEDPEFGRGGDVYQRYLGDPQHGPNPCVRPIEAAPFYALRLYPADLGTSAGLATDAEARVLDAQGAPIPGIYACGNDMNSIMNGAYPGPGITLGPALTFGFIAAKRLLQAP